jgi:Cu(I)/Ag(I) efflux system membrane fusion protein
MTATRRKWPGRLAVVAAVAIIGGGLWYAHGRGWLAPASDWLRQLASGHGGGQPAGDMGGMNMPGMDMGMGGMAMGAPSQVPGHAEVMIAPGLAQRIGVTVGQVEKAPLRMSVRTVGIVRPDETKVARVHLKTEGWAEKLFVNFTGQRVRKGDPLLAIYSPEFVATQQNYLDARQGGRESDAVLALERLKLWDVPSEALEELKRTGKPRRALTLESPLPGTVLEENVREKDYVTPQKELYVIADLSTVWVQAKVYEYELPHVELGQPATVTTAALPGRELTGKVVFIQPTVEEPARTVQVRVELPNKGGLLKPGLFANVAIAHTMGEGLLVPASAVIRTGERDIAFRAESAPGQEADRFVPVEVKISPFRFVDRFQVLEGLTAGDKVVTAADFLIDSESRLRFGGMGGMPGMEGMDMGGMKGMGQK